MGGLVLLGLLIGAGAFWAGLKWGPLTLLLPGAVLVIGLLIAEGGSDEIGPSGFMSERAGGQILTILLTLPLAVGALLGVLVWGVVRLRRGWQRWSAPEFSVDPVAPRGNPRPAVPAPAAPPRRRTRVRTPQRSPPPG